MLLIINLGLGPVFHPAAWRHPDTDLRGSFDFEAYRALTLAAESAKIHAVFSADTLAVDENQLSGTPVRVLSRSPSTRPSPRPPAGSA
jgi:hypothetical protein